MFVAVTVGSAVLLVVAAVLVARVGVGRLDRRAARAENGSPRVGIEGVAALVGGSEQVVAAAIARLVAADVVRVADDGTLHRTGRVAHGPLDQRIVALVSVYGRPATARELAVVMRSEPLVDQLVRSTRDAGLLHDPDAVLRCRSLARPCLLLASLAVLVLIFSGEVSGVLSALPLVLAILVGWWAVRRATRTPRSTPAGLALVAAARESVRGRRHAVATRASDDGSTAPSVVEPAQAAEQVAIGGLGSFPDPRVGRLLLTPPMTPAASRPRASGAGAADGGGGGG